MLVRVLVLLFIATLLNPVQAQESGEVVWNWAWNRSTGELFAYSESGEINLLLSDVTGWLDNFWRISTKEAVGLVNVSDQLSLYMLSELFAEPIKVAFRDDLLDQYLEDGSGLRIAEYSYPYMVLTTWNPIGSTALRPALLVDLSTTQVELLSESTQPIFRLVPNTNQLRYIHVDEDDDFRSTELRELSLSDGSERTLYELPGDVFVTGSDTNGDRWLIEGQDPNSTMPQYHIFHVATGNDEIIYVRNPDEFYTSYQFIVDDLISYQPLCETDCTLELRTGDGTVLLYPLPDTPGGAGIYSFYRSHDNILTIGRLYDFWHLRPEASPVYIGYGYRGGSHLPSISSPDKRFSLIADTEQYPPSERRLIDMETLETIIILPRELEDPVYMTYLYEGFIINTLNRGPRVMYRYDDHSLVDLPDIDYGTYFEILPNGNVLYSRVTDDSKMQIFRYSPYDNETQLLIEDVLSVHVVDIRRTS